MLKRTNLEDKRNMMKYLRKKMPRRISLFSNNNLCKNVKFLLGEYTVRGAFAWRFHIIRNPDKILKSDSDLRIRSMSAARCRGQRGHH